MDPDSSTSKDNANPTVLDASALPTRRRQQQRTRQSNTSNENEDEGYDTGRDDTLGKTRRRRRRGEGGGGMESRISTSDGDTDSGSGSGSSGSRNRLRNGNAKVKTNPFFDELLAGASLAGGGVVGRGYMDEMFSGSADEEDGVDGVENELDNNYNHAVDIDDDDEEIDEQEIYDLIAPISDPEHPLSLGSLAVVNLPDIHLSSSSSSSSRLTKATILLTPTITHCSLATVIGLAVRVRLEQALPPRFRVSVRIKPGTHTSAEAVSKQLADKERVAAALENGALRGVLRKMMATCG